MGGPDVLDRGDRGEHAGVWVEVGERGAAVLVVRAEPERGHPRRRRELLHVCQQQLSDALALHVYPHGYGMDLPDMPAVLRECADSAR